MVVNNTQAVSRGSWTVPAVADRGPGAWPPLSATAAEIGDYLCTDAVFSQSLSDIGIDVLLKLPNLGTDPVSVAQYSQVDSILNDVTSKDPITKGPISYVRWTLPTVYPAGTKQGTRDVGGSALAPNQRYALYIRFPASPTLVAGQARPNADHVMVRVSWGADVNDPTTSRIFCLNSGETGGYWKRIQTSTADDRYFPYDGVSPLVVTLYSLSPDSQPNAAGVNTLATADAIRLVPEALRGDIHAPAASAIVDRLTTNAGIVERKLTYFGRDEPVGPFRLFPTVASYTAAGAFEPVPLNPTVAPSATNPIVADPTSSITTAALYCFQDDEPVTTAQKKNGAYGALRWRYVAASSQIRPLLTDDGLAGYGDTGFAAVSGATARADQAFGPQYHIMRAVAPPAGAPPGTRRAPTATAWWGGQFKVDTTYTVMVWIPGGNSRAIPLDYTQNARYVIHGSGAPAIVVTLDQQNVPVGTPPAGRFGTWRVLASGVPFEAGALTRAVELFNDSTDPADSARYVVADAIRFIPNPQVPNSIGAGAVPSIAEVTWPGASGGTPTPRKVTFWATVDGHVWAIDALGNAGVTFAYWVYPSIGNPDLAQNPTGGFVSPQDDPNYLPETIGGVQKRAVDGDLSPSRGTGRAGAYTVTNRVPELGAFVSSAQYIRVSSASNPEGDQYVAVGNQNGRVYLLDAVGRTNAVGQPFADTLTGEAPGTTRRAMTWPNTARDKWIRLGGAFKTHTDDPAHGGFVASLTFAGATDEAPPLWATAIANSTDGRVYALDLHRFSAADRLYNFLAPPSKLSGLPLWTFPEMSAQLASITMPGLVTSPALPASPKYVFTAGGRVYGISMPPVADAKKHKVPEWTYPWATAPGVVNKSGDTPSEDQTFTAPAYYVSTSGTESLFVANRDGSIHALDPSGTGNAAPAVRWTSKARASTRASVVFLNHLTPNARLHSGTVTPDWRSLLLPTDAGSILGLLHTSPSGAPLPGTLTWEMADGVVGSVPLTGTSLIGGTSVTVPTPTSVVWRGADATTANRWVYQGDEGNQLTGEHNGQMHAYSSRENIGLVTPEEPIYDPDTDTWSDVSLRLVNVYDPKITTVGDTPKANLPAGSGMVVYEWGDTIYAGAWGVVAVSPANLARTFPLVTFRLVGAGQTVIPATVQGVEDLTTGRHTLADGTILIPWVANTSFPLGRGSAANPQTPGSKYRVYASAALADPVRGRMTTLELEAGQSATVAVPPSPWWEPLTPTGPFGTPRALAVAHPLSISTRGVPASSPAPNVMAWLGVPSSVAQLAELLANGNRLYSTGGSSALPKDVVAPLCFIEHGGSATYLGTRAGVSEPAFFIADRSNMYKLNQQLNNIRADRRELGWGWDAESGSPTGNVMNPLPWEVFPVNVPNTSGDYPDIDRSRVTLRVGGVDMTARGVSLPNASIVGGAKTLNRAEVELVVSPQRFQPANVNTFYLDINGASGTLYGPMDNVTGGPVAGGSALRAPSAGYYGRALIYVDTNNDGKYQGSPVPAQPGAAQAASQEEVYRQVSVGVAVPPDMKMSAQEHTIDLGKLPHSGGYSPTLPFVPLGPWDSLSGLSFFAPFAVQNQGNVNLVNVGVAKIYGSAATANNPDFWARLTSDQVNPYQSAWKVNNGIVGRAIATNIGIVSSLDAQFWPRSVASPDYVESGNDLGWPAGTRPAASIHKARPGDTTGTTLSIPDVAYGDPLGVLAAQGLAGQPIMPRIGVPIPMGTPVGTYTTPMHVFEDGWPAQWRAWLAEYASGTGRPNPLDPAVDGDGILNVPIDAATGQASGTAAEPLVQNPAILKVTVRENRLTNAVSVAIPSTTAYLQTDGTHPQVDLRVAGTPSLGANTMPAVTRDRVTGAMPMVWVSNRPTPVQDSAWQLFTSQLKGVATTVNGQLPYYDWQYASPSQWWRPVASEYPANTLAPTIFSSASPAGVPGSLLSNSGSSWFVRYGGPSLAQDEVAAAAPMWVFFHGSAPKAAGGQATQTDSRLLYAPMAYSAATGFAPDVSGNGGAPYVIPTDPTVPKQSPRAVVVSGQAIVVWRGGAQGRARLYASANRNLTGGGAWTAEVALPTPGGLQGLSDPAPVARLIGGERYVDVVYSGEFRDRKQPEVFLTRYSFASLLAGRASVKELPTVIDETLARQGVTATWFSRDIAWITQVGGVYTPGLVTIKVNGLQVSSGVPQADSATGRLYFDSTLGGRLWVDPQNGSVGFPDIAPKLTDRVQATYTPRTMRLNVTRDPSGVFVSAPGANTGPVAFLDRSDNPKRLLEPDVVLPAGSAMPVTRYWVMYRKTGSNVTGSGALYYKTLRLMMRLPETPARGSVAVTGANGPYEVDWVRGRVYFTEADDARTTPVTATYRDLSGASSTYTAMVTWGDEMTSSALPVDQTSGETMLPTDTVVNEAVVSAFKDPFLDRVWVFWSSSRSGSTDLYSMTISPNFYPQVK